MCVCEKQNELFSPGFLMLASSHVSLYWIEVLSEGLLVIHSGKRCSVGPVSLWTKPQRHPSARLISALKDEGTSPSIPAR